jgi:glycine/D-amino acid oxidase-like deaminating enzyme
MILVSTTSNVRAPSKAVYWLEEALSEEGALACPPLTGTQRCDVCIVGGGYTGLWTALQLRELAADARVIVVESESCGFGASGRNGGWATSWYDELDGLRAKFGDTSAVWLADESSRTIARMGEFVRENAIDCDFSAKGTIWIASSAEQSAVLASAAADCRALGRGSVIDELSAEQVDELTGTRNARFGALLIHDSARVQPARLVRGLRRVALREGVEIFEGSRMIELRREQPAVVVTSAGRVEADEVVLATNAWMAQIRELRRAVAVVGTQVVLTEPISDGSLRPWKSGFLLGDARLFVHYAQVTREGRIAFGRGGGVIGPLGRVVPRHFQDDHFAQGVADDFRHWFPQYADVPITHVWGGAVDRAPGHLPFVGSLGAGNIHYGLGYSGNGVGPSGLIGRILARRALRMCDEYTTCALVGGPPGYLPPEPLRYIGGTLVRNTVKRTEEYEELGGSAGPVGRLAKRLVTFSTPALRPRASGKARA